jgi:D-glycero-alpha-D-manno-heptose-7-phosphate kinase
MITSRAPLRLSLGGGGTDLPAFYKKHGGYLIAAGINKYIYNTIIQPFKPGIYLKYSKIEKVKDISKIKHQIIKTILKNEYGKKEKPQIEITTLADVPSGTGLGSSGSFTVGLTLALKNFRNKIIDKEELAKYACDVEINQLKQPVGKQDQYISTYGGLTEFYFHKSGKVSANRINIKEDFLNELNENLVLFFTGYSRSASEVLYDQNKKASINNKEIIDNLKLTKELGFKSKECLEKSDLQKYGELTHYHWIHKIRRSKLISNKKINKWYNEGLANGAYGGKVVGAGGGGFLLFVAKNKYKLIKKMKEFGLKETKYSFEHDGAKIINT